MLVNAVLLAAAGGDSVCLSVSDVVPAVALHCCLTLSQLWSLAVVSSCLTLLSRGFLTLSRCCLTLLSHSAASRLCVTLFRAPVCLTFALSRSCVIQVAIHVTVRPRLSSAVCRLPSLVSRLRLAPVCMCMSVCRLPTVTWPVWLTMYQTVRC